MVSPRTPKIVKRYGPSEGRNLVGSGNNTVALKKRFEPTSGGVVGGGGGGGVGGEVFDYLRASKNGSGNGNENNGWNNWEDERGGVTEEMFLERALAAIEEAGARGDGMVEMGEQEWRAWNRHEAMEREIEKRVVEREREREKQRERDLARAEELQRELDMLRQTTITRTGTFGPSNGEPGFLVDQRLSPFGAGYASNSSSSSSLPAKITRPYSTFAASHREARFVPDSADPTPVQNLRPTLPPRDQQRENQTYPPPSSRPLPSQQSSPALSHLQPVQPVSATTSRTASPRRSSSRSSSLTREGHRSKRSITSSASVPPGADLAPGGSYHPGAYPTIPTSKSAGALTGKSGKEGKKEKGKKGSDPEEDVYSSAAAALKDVRRRRRL